MREIRRDKAHKKRLELEAGLKVSLRDEAIETYEYQTKMKAIANNMHLIEEAVDNPKKLAKLETDLEIVTEKIKDPRHPVSQIDQVKFMDKEDLKKRERDAKQLIKNLKEDRAKREEKKKKQDEELRKKFLLEEKEMKEREAKLKKEKWVQKVEKKKAIESAKKAR